MSKHITYRNEIKHIFDPNMEILRHLQPNAQKYTTTNVYYMVLYTTKDGLPLHEKFDNEKVAEVHAKWALRNNMQNVSMELVKQETTIHLMYKYALPTPAEGKSERCERVCNVVAHQCKNFANANCDAVPTGNSNEFQLPEIPF